MMTDASIPIIDALGKMYGKSNGEILKMAESGQITAGDIDKAFTQMTSSGGIFANLMEKQSKTSIGLWSTITGQISAAAMNIGESLQPLIQEVLTVLQGWSEELLKFSTDGRAVRLISTIAITGIEATAKIAKGFVIVREYAAATFMAIADLGVSIWNGIQGSAMLAFTGVIKSVNTLVEYVPAAFKQMRNILSAIWDGIKWACASMFSGLVNLVLKAVNSVIGLLKKIPGVKLEMVKKPAFVSQVEAFAKQAGENARKKFQDVANSKEFTDAGKRTEEKNAKWKSTDQKGEALVQKSANGILSAANRFSVAGENIERIGESIDKMSGSATSKILDWQSKAESDLAKKNKKGDVGKEEKITGTAKSATEKKSEKIATDSLTKIGLYGNFRSDAVRSIDRERNKLLENILAKVSEMKEGGLLA